MNRTQIAPGAFITTLPGEKFKRCKISINLILPGTREDATALAVLPHILERRCEAIPDPLRLTRRLFNLYGAELSAESSAIGAQCPPNDYAINGTLLNRLGSRKAINEARAHYGVSSDRDLVLIFRRKLAS